MTDRMRAIILFLRAEEMSRKAAESRAALSPGSTRAGVTSANARWSRTAEHRDRMAAGLHPDTVAALRRELDAEVSDG